MLYCIPSLRMDATQYNKLRLDKQRIVKCKYLTDWKKCVLIIVEGLKKLPKSHRLKKLPKEKESNHGINKEHVKRDGSYR